MHMCVNVCMHACTLRASEMCVRARERCVRVCKLCVCVLALTRCMTAGWWRAGSVWRRRLCRGLPFALPGEALREGPSGEAASFAARPSSAGLSGTMPSSISCSPAPDRASKEGEGDTGVYESAVGMGRGPFPDERLARA